MNPRLALLGVAMVFVGFLVVAMGTFIGPGGSSSTGGFILIGPVPIVFGSGPNSGVLAAVGLVITVAMVAAYLLSFLFWRSGGRREVGRRRGLEGKTPAEAAGIKVEGDDKWLTLIQNASHAIHGEER